MLVTGAAGFIGLHAVVALRERGWRVHALARRGGDRLAHVDGVEWWEADLADDEALAGAVGSAAPDAVLHLAWTSEPGRMTDVDGNLRARRWTLRLAELLGGTRCRHLVLAGSCIESRPDTAAGRTPYAVAKRAVHETLVAAGGVPVTCAHIHSTLGPGEPEDRMVPRAVRALLAGEPLDVSAGTQTRDFLAVEDVASALATVVGAPACGEIDVCSGRPTRLDALFTALEAACDADGGLLRRGAAELPAWALFDAIGSPDRLAELGWRPSRSFDEAVAASVAWWSTRVPAR